MCLLFRLGSASIYGGMAFAGLCYFTDWKVVMTKVPFYNKKFIEQASEEEEE